MKSITVAVFALLAAVLMLSSAGAVGRHNNTQNKPASVRVP
jgi:hypothetical protein